MTRKEDLVKEVYRLKNMIAEVKGTEPIDIDQHVRTRSFFEEVKCGRVYDLEQRIAFLQKEYRKTVEQKEREERATAYFATPEGAARKQALENEIDAIRQASKKEEKRLVADFEFHIQQILGVHWGVDRYVKGNLRIGVIDEEKSTPEQREFFFGQTFEICYDERSWGVGQERFDTNIGTCGPCLMTGGQTVGERTFFYIGVGQLFANTELLEYLRTTMRDAARNFDKAIEKVVNLQAELQDPTKN